MLYPIDPPTKHSLHQASKILLTARLLGLDPLPNGLRHSLMPIEGGVTTGKLSFGGELQLRFDHASIRHVQEGIIKFDVPMQGHSQKSLFQAVYDEYATLGLSLTPDASHITEEAPLEFSIAYSQQLEQTMQTVYGWIAGIKACFWGFQTPLVLWAHGFDLSTVWFARGMDEHNDPHLNIGFSFGTPDVGEPYLYFYAHPTPADMQSYLPKGMTWTTSWSAPGGLLRLSEFGNHPAETIPHIVWDIYTHASMLLKRG